MKPMIIVPRDTITQYQRREIFAYLGSFVGQGIAFVLGVAFQWKWDIIGRMLT